MQINQLLAFVFHLVAPLVMSSQPGLEKFLMPLFVFLTAYDVTRLYPGKPCGRRVPVVRTFALQLVDLGSISVLNHTEDLNNDI